MLNILLACGSGASSGFIAQSMRKAAKTMGLDCQIKAVSDIEIINYLEEIDLLMIGPHIQHRFNELQEKSSSSGVAIGVIDHKKYSMLDGEGILNDALELLKRKGD